MKIRLLIWHKKKTLKSRIIFILLHEASDSSEGLDGATGESAQRCKARLERHQRTAERAVCLLLSFFSTTPFSSPHPLTPVEDVRTSICRYLKSSPFFLWVGCFQAKALAEKNKRDLLAQKEQAERNVIVHSNEMRNLL